MLEEINYLLNYTRNQTQMFEFCHTNVLFFSIDRRFLYQKNARLAGVNSIDQGYITVG